LRSLAARQGVYFSTISNAVSLWEFVLFTSTPHCKTSIQWYYLTWTKNMYNASFKRFQLF
jgi:hypothetical protein